MAKSKRNRRAHNKIADSLQGALVKSGPPVEPAVEVLHASAVRLARPTLFTAEFEKVIEIIARERVRRAMLARLGSRLLMAPKASGEVTGGSTLESDIGRE